jgi:tRNA pseudouridine38-40 synthase
MKRIALGIEYQGTPFHGWQSQDPQYPTVQSALEYALGQVASHPVETFCAGRTDAGVHATEQVAHFDTSVERSSKAWVLGTNLHLPKEVSVKWCAEVPDSFHARFSALRRRYRYIIYNYFSRPALLNQRVTWVTVPLNADKMQLAGQVLLGEHDFSSFRAAECQAASPIRRVDELTVERRGDYVVLEIEANAFLHHMVRNILGVLIPIGSGKQTVDWIEKVLLAKDRRQAGVTAVPDGLYLVKVRYPEEFRLPKNDGFNEVLM